jgi:NhaP-type Na+/H+ or K+/H+ antiporter
VNFLANLALVSVLFTDAMKTGFRDLASAWRLPGRALLLGFPLTLAGTAILAHWVAQLNWIDALLVGAVLSPTDPVFAAAIVGNDRMPKRLRHLLNVESGLNDGLTAPIVVIALGALSSAQGHDSIALAWGAPMGVLIGIAIPWLVIRLEQSRFFSADVLYRALFVFAIGMSVWSTCMVAHCNQYLGCFAAGMTVATLDEKLRANFRLLGEQISELLKLAALLVFGALISVHELAGIGWGGYLFVGLTLLLVRPVMMNIALLGSPITWRERMTAAWFGPKGFASVVFGLLILEARVPHAQYMFHLIWLSIAASIVVHSSTDVPLAKWLEKNMGEDPESGSSVAVE